MPRKPRQLTDDGVYHLISRGNNYAQILSVEGGFERFMEILRQARTRYGIRLHHYCLMPNHVHLLATVPKGDDLPKIMRFILWQYSMWHKWQTSYVGHLWQSPYKSPLIQNDTYLLECGRYIERNPVRANLCQQPEDYRWSSYRYYTFGEYDPMVDPDPCYENFGASPPDRQKNYRDFAALPPSPVPGTYQVPVL